MTDFTQKPLIKKSYEMVSRVFNLVIKKYFAVALCGGVIILIILYYFLFIYDIGLNSNFFVKKDFNAAFLARQTGNCTEFEKYISKRVRQGGEGLDLTSIADTLNGKCLAEKKGGSLQIKDFKILKITNQSDRAYLQVQLNRDAYNIELALAAAGHKIPDGGYLVTYEMERKNGQWYILEK